MYLMYVDESGDCGLLSDRSPTRYFVLSGLVVHELRWRQVLDQLVDFRRRMRHKFGLRLREEIHAAAMVSRTPGDLARIQKHDRLTILRHSIAEIASVPDISIINVLVDKQNKPAGYSVFENAWKALIQRFENTLSHRNFPGPHNPDERGILFPDETDDKKLRLLVRRMRRFNPVPNRVPFGPGHRNLPLLTIVEDPNFRRSADSYFIQAVDTVAYFLLQSVQPNGYIRRQGGTKYFERLRPVLCTVASSGDPLGVVRV
jgi:hypothetical protein